MKKQILQNQIKARRHKRVRAKVFGTAKRPRLSVFRSSGHIYAQLINDDTGVTLASVKDAEIKDKKNKIEAAFVVGQLIAQKAEDQKIKQVVFDKGVFKYHGRVKAVAEGAREAGLKI